MKTIAQQLNVKDFPLIIKDKNGTVIYHENSDGFCARMEYDSEGNEIYNENSDGFSVKREYDSEGNRIYTEYSDGEIIDNRPKEIITLNGVKYKRIDE